MLNVIFGEKNSGKTLTAHKILETSVENGLDTMLIVPKQFTFQSDKGILSLMGPKNASEVQVLSFTRLASLVLTTFGGITKPFAKEGARAIFMSLAVESLKDKLQVFSGHKNEFSLVTKLLSAVDEFKNFGIEPETLRKTALHCNDLLLKNKLVETALIFETYEAIVQESHFDDADLLMKIYEILLPTSFFENQVIVIDGFGEFTYPERKLISLMIKRAKDVYITLCSNNLGDMSENSPFAFTNKTYRKLRLMANENGVDINVMPAKGEEKVISKELLFLRKNLFASVYTPYKEKCEDIEIISADTIHSECDCVARKIKHLIMSEKYRLGDFTVVYRNDEKYEKTLRTSFKKYGISFFEDKRQPINNQPLVNLVRNLLLILDEGFSSDYVFRLLKTGLFPINSDEIAFLENYVFLWSIDKNAWCEQWTQNPDGFGVELSERRKEQLSSINLIKNTVVTPIKKLRDEMKGVSGKKAITLLYNFIKDIKADEALKNYALSLQERGLIELAIEQQQVWDILMETFDEIAVTLDEHIVSAKRLYEIFSLIISVKTLGKLPDGFDEVYVCSADRILTKNSKIVFAVGMNSGVFPLSASDNGLFGEREKKKLELLGTKIGDDIKQFTIKERFLLYCSFASAEEKLYLSYSSSNLKGEKLLKSEAVERIEKLFLNITTYISDKNDVKDLIVGESSAFEYLAQNWNENTPETATLKEYFSGKEEYKGRIAAIERAVNKKDFAIEDKSVALSLFGQNMRFSATRVEVFSKCPFMYFCRYGLNLKARKAAELDPMLGGTLIHHVLETVMKKYKGKAFAELSEKELQREIDIVLFAYMDNFMGGKEKVTDRFYYLFSRMRKVIMSLFERLKAEFSQSDFEPCDFELNIGEDERVDSFKIELQNGQIEFIGQVDRVDKMDLDGKRYIRIVDYKTGTKTFQLGDVFSGFNMQMLLYLISIWRTGKKDYENIIPSGVLYFPANLSAFNGERGDSEEKRKLKALSLGKMSGMLVNDGVAIEHMDKEKTGLFVPVKYDKKTGQVKGDFITINQLEKIGGIIDSTIRKMGESLHSGVVSATPVFQKAYKDTCSYCDFKTVCLNENPKNNFIKKYTHDECLRMLGAGEDVE